MGFCRKHPWSSAFASVAFVGSQHETGRVSVSLCRPTGFIVQLSHAQGVPSVSALGFSGLLSVGPSSPAFCLVSSLLLVCLSLTLKVSAYEPEGPSGRHLSPVSLVLQLL